VSGRDYCSPETAMRLSTVFACVRVLSEDVAAAWARFKEAGLRTLTEENTECCYALQDKVWVEDPDGNAWEVFVVKGEAAVMETPSTTSACCAPKIQDDTNAKASGGCCG
jgi:uncharacterized glyoxalase superfamily protein PhnB